VTADPERLKQVFINLMTNAVQAMGKGGKLFLRSRMGEAGDGRPAALVEVQDTGSGIRPENLKKIFEPLFSTKAKGTGLGLAICQGIMEAHGGKILVTSELDKGSTFTVLIPIGGKRHDSQTGQ
jgi:signal transduction histidine kinase